MALEHNVIALPPFLSSNLGRKHCARRLTNGRTHGEKVDRPHHNVLHGEADFRSVAPTNKVLLWGSINIYFSQMAALPVSFPLPVSVVPRADAAHCSCPTYQRPWRHRPRF